MSKFRAALIAAALTVSIVGGAAGAVSSNNAAPATDIITKYSAKDGTGWCC